jgi:hypothetical protein
MAWTKQTKIIPDTYPDGWGDIEWGSGAWGSPTGSAWIVVSKAIDSWTKQTKAE